MTAATIAARTLHDGTVIPVLGLGVWQMSEQEAESAVIAAHEAGYSLIDTAAGYENEAAVGRAIARFDRDGFFVTTKLRNDDHGREATLRAFDSSLDTLGIDVLDLYLIHWPSPGRDAYVESWRTLAELKEQGRVRSIGVSNFLPHHLDRIIAETGVVPVVNQIELHPLLLQQELRAYHADHDIATEAWSPLGSGRAAVLEHPVVTRIAEGHGATPAQVIIAWHLAIGNIVIPKSVAAARIAENLGAVDVALAAEEIAEIDGLGDGIRFGPHPDHFN